MTYKNKGPNIHHNIFSDIVGKPINIPGSDFAQVHNNIFDQLGLTEYDGEMMGFFSSEALSTIAPGLATFINSSKFSFRDFSSLYRREVKSACRGRTLSNRTLFKCHT